MISNINVHSLTLLFPVVGTADGQSEGLTTTIELNALHLDPKCFNW